MTPEENDDVTIIDADYTLLNKVGKNNLDKFLAPEVVRKAEKVIADSADEFYADCINESAKLQKAIGQLKEGMPSADSSVKNIIATAFGIKTKSGQAGFDLVADLAKSLHILCEEKIETALTAPTVKVIDWHGNSIHHLLSAKVKGRGGEIGKAILGEIAKLNIKRG
jgi:hypothetical protein